MALQTKSKLEWADIKNIYVKLNQAKTKFSMPEVTIPEEQKKKAVPSNVSDIKDEILDMINSNEYISDANISVSNINVPARKTRIYPTPFQGLSNTIDQILEVCPHNGNYNGAEFNGSVGGGEDFGCNIFHSATQCPGWVWCSNQMDHCGGFGTNSF